MRPRQPQPQQHNDEQHAVVLLWLGLTWPHFRQALTLEAFGKMTVLALLANVCYCAAYLVEFFLQPVASNGGRRRLRWAVWILGMLLALLVENYWIADEIYPDFNQKQGTVM